MDGFRTEETICDDEFLLGGGDSDDGVRASLSLADGLEGGESASGRSDSEDVSLLTGSGGRE